MTRSRLLFLFFFFALATGCAGRDEDHATSRDDDLWAHNATLWPRTGATTVISVCWDTAGDEDTKRLVREMAIGSWGTAAAIDFVGWESCGARGADLRIRIADEQARVEDFGTRIRGMPGGVTLNATFLRWNTECHRTKEACIVSETLHELGHALGFLHEQDRDDMPSGACSFRTDTPTTDAVLLGQYDSMSIMNYCNPDLYERPHLSDLDIEGVRRVYGARETTDIRDRCAFSAGFEGARCASGLGDESDTATLLVCSGNRTVSSSVCENGCRVSPSGRADECIPRGAAVDPCARSKGGNRFICARELGGDPDSPELLFCQQNQSTLSHTCANGCMTISPVANDACIDGNPCAAANGFDGAVCGTSLGEGAHSTMLYTCRGNRTIAGTACAQGCKVMPSDEDDQCNDPNPCARSNGFEGTQCGSRLSLGGSEASRLYLCSDNRTLGSMDCPRGCHSLPGFADSCQ